MSFTGFILSVFLLFHTVTFAVSYNSKLYIVDMLILFMLRYIHVQLTAVVLIAVLSSHALYCAIFFCSSLCYILQIKPCRLHCGVYIVCLLVTSVFILSSDIHGKGTSLKSVRISPERSVCLLTLQYDDEEEHEDDCLT